MKGGAVLGFGIVRWKEAPLTTSGQPGPRILFWQVAVMGADLVESFDGFRGTQDFMPDERALSPFLVRTNPINSTTS